ncbi:MAG: 1,4-alpha-glucan branching enzyme [Candidatus Saccharibacteria bacterium]|nr:1,4-alpha-glucan branching enzyme [Candidatus Saccharibacteria bacterium]
MADEDEGEVTTNHDEIRQWAEARGGKPARVRGTGNGTDVGLLRIKFQDNEDLEEISWDEFFEEFEKNNLAFLYQEKTADGNESRFFKFIKRP